MCFRILSWSSQILLPVLSYIPLSILFILHFTIADKSRELSNIETLFVSGPQKGANTVQEVKRTETIWL